MWFELMDEQETRGQSVDGVPAVQMVTDGAFFDCMSWWSSVLMAGSVDSADFYD